MNHERNIDRWAGSNLLRSLGAALLVCAFVVAANAQLLSGDDPNASPIWHKARASYFGDRPIAVAGPKTLVLEAPARAVDAAVVPIAIRTPAAPTPAQQIAKIYLFIDENPSPIAAIFQFEPGHGRVEVETRVRVDAYSFVRAVAETSDGRLVMATRFVKASGGCSAPAGTDAAAALANIGKMRMSLAAGGNAGEPVLLQLQISHPNHSGLAMDQATRRYTPAHFVRLVDVSHGGKPVFSADVDFSISENPTFRFHFVPKGAADVAVAVVDSHDRKFAATYKLAELMK